MTLKKDFLWGGAEEQLLHINLKEDGMPAEREFLLLMS